MKSKEFLQAAIDVQKERGAQYDKPSGERSMGATVSAFNCITGNNLKEQDGWMLLGLLKLVRQSQNPEKYHHDSALDFVAYASLYAEAASEQCKQVESIDIWLTAPVEATHLLKANFDISKGGAYQFARFEDGKYLDLYEYGTSFLVRDNSWVVHSVRQQQ